MSVALVSQRSAISCLHPILMFSLRQRIGVREAGLMVASSRAMVGARLRDTKGSYPFLLLLKCQRTNNSICWCFPCSPLSSHAPAIRIGLSTFSFARRGPIPRPTRYTEICPPTANFQFSTLTCKNAFNPSVMSRIMDNTRSAQASGTLSI